MNGADSLTHRPWRNGMNQSTASRRGGKANVPVPPPTMPTVGNFFTRWLGAALMRLTGWKFSGPGFPMVPRFVLIVAPHTSNWDFLVGVMAKAAIGLKGTFLAKDTLFRFPLGIWMRFLGGVPVDRSSQSDVVTQTAELIEKRDRIIVVLTPEGTRKRTESWRSGFYWIALKANVPIVPVAFDYSQREVRLFPPYFPTGDAEGDIRAIRDMYRPGMARYPEQFGV